MIIILIVNSFLSARREIYKNDHANGIRLPSSRAWQNETMSCCVARLSWAWVGGQDSKQKKCTALAGLKQRGRCERYDWSIPFGGAHFTNGGIQSSLRRGSFQECGSSRRNGFRCRTPLLIMIIILIVNSFFLLWLTKSILSVN